MELVTVRLEIPDGTNIILGQSHFIKTVEDIYETIVSTVPQMKFGVAFCEASGECLVRFDGNDEAMKDAAVKNALAVGAGHSFIVVLKDGFPINIVARLKEVPEIVGLYCATANPVEVIMAQSGQGRGILGVIDGSSPKGVEDEAGKAWRHGFLRKIGYKR
jgi:adenosine/AMP kinase